MQKTNKIFSIATIIIGLILVGCLRNEIPEDDVSPNTLPITNASTEIQDGKIETQTPSLEEAIFTPMNLLFFDQTLTPTIEQTITQIPALPAIPTIEVEGNIINLLQDNGGCELPCLWGISFTQLNAQTINSYLNSVTGVGRSTISLSRNNSDIRISPNWVEAENSQIRYFTVVLGDYRTVDFGDGPYDVYIFDNPVFYEYTKYYGLSNILSVYGQPEKIYVYIDPGRDMGFEDLYHILLDYSKSGFIVHYTMKLTTETDYFVGCPEKSFMYLKLWTPGDTSVEVEVNKIIKDMGYHPLDEMTSLTLQEFVEIYKNPNSQNCLRTKKDFYKQY